MTLTTSSKLPIVPALSGPISQQTELTNMGMAVAQITIWSLLHVRGLDAEKLLSAEYNISPITIGGAESIPDGILLRLRRDEFLLLTTDLKSAMNHLNSKQGDGLITLTDITHGRDVVGLTGAHARDVLSKICALDFADSTFPDLHAAQAMLGNVRALILRMDTAQTPAYFVIIERSLSGYIWQIILDAAQEWDAIVLNQDSLDLKRIK